MPDAPGPHPRLLFGKEDIPALREWAQEGLRGRMLERLVHACECFLDSSHPQHFDFRERRRELWQQRSGIFAVLPTLNALATAYVFTGREEFAECVRDAVMTIIDEGLADVHSLAYGNTNEGWRHGPGHDKGKFAQAIAWTYDTCSHCFSPEQRARLGDYATESIELAAEHRTFDQAQIANNRGVAGIMVPFIYSLVLEGESELPEVTPLMVNAVVNIERYLFLSFDGDGAPYEGPGYAGRLSFVTWLADAIRRRGGPDLLTNDRFERFLDYLLYELIPGTDSVNDLNDTRIPCGSVAGCLHLMGTESGALLPWLARRLDLHPERTASWLNGEDWEPGDFDLASFLPFLLHWDDDAPVRTPQELGYPLSHCFTTRGVASMRSGWDDDDALVSHFSGRQELYCHRQGDFNHLSFYALGEPFLVDAGYGPPFRELAQPVDRWFGLTSAHNCVLIDGMEQRGVIESPGWAEGRILDFQHSEAFDTSLGDASSCTGPDHRVKRSLRRVAFVRGAPLPFLAVLDVNEKDGEPFLAECLWITDPDATLETDDRGAVIQGKENDCQVCVLWPLDAQISMGESFGRPQLKIAVEERVAEMVTLFCPIRRGETPPVFSCAREAEGQFLVTCDQNGQTVTLRLTAITSGPLRKPVHSELV